MRFETTVDHTAETMTEEKRKNTYVSLDNKRTRSPVQQPQQESSCGWKW